jgi:type IV fimbrial biogenesis protein FimT
MLSASSQGFSIIELLVAVTIAAVLLGLGAPALSTYLQNAKIGAAAQSLQAGISFARTEAIRRNAPVEFVLTNSDVSASDIANTVASAPAGRNWIVRAPQLGASAASFDLLEAKSGQEGEGQASTPSVLIAASGVFPGSIVFNGLGGTQGAAVAFDVTNPAGGACVSALGPMRCRRVGVSAGGQVRTCDPTVTDTFDTRYCAGL